MIKAENLTIGYESKIVVNDFSMRIRKGEIVSIIGPNGSGKSTILKAISRLLETKRGSIYLSGKQISDMNNKEIAKEMAVLSQENNSPSDFTIRDLVYYGRMPHKKWYQSRTDEDEKIIDWALYKTRLTHMCKRKVIELSGGERQRAWIAMALAQKPQILLLDEPTTYLDICHQLEIMELVKSLNEELNLTVVMVLHDLNQASKYSHRLYVLKDGKLVKEGPPEKVLTERLIRNVYNVETEIRIDSKTGRPNILSIGVAKTV